MKIGVTLLVALTAAITLSEGRAADPAMELRLDLSGVGRYQLVTATDGKLFLLDTKTGQCWSRSALGEWRDEGNPTAKLSKGAPPPPQAPLTLELPSKLVEMTIIQREERAIPGSDGSIRIQLGDITEGQVLLAVVTADERYLMERTSIKQGETVELWLGKKRYAIHVKELRNILIGDDFARITIGEAAEPAPAIKPRPVERK